MNNEKYYYFTEKETKYLEEILSDLEKYKENPQDVYLGWFEIGETFAQLLARFIHNMNLKIKHGNQEQK